jgi:hypothetical protein
MSDLAMKAYPCKRNQEHKQEQEKHNENYIDYEVGVSQTDERRYCSMTYMI